MSIIAELNRGKEKLYDFIGVDCEPGNCTQVIDKIFKNLELDNKLINIVNEQDVDICDHVDCKGTINDFYDSTLNMLKIPVVTYYITSLIIIISIILLLIYYGKDK